MPDIRYLPDVRYYVLVLLLAPGKKAVRIPLDYYRILGLPIQATAEQIQQSYRDRLLQLPRQEYSEKAIAARKALLDKAYIVLADPQTQQAYQQILKVETQKSVSQLTETNAQPLVASDPEMVGSLHATHIDIQEDQIAGALIIFLELGEYELVLRVGQAYLGSVNVRLRSKYSDKSETDQADVVLSVAMACLELGREQWQRGHYANATESLEVGQDLLLKEGLFTAVRNEIQSDLYRLRPYRVLELLALPEENTSERKKGLQLLQTMLEQRIGIDGSGNDQSGLNVDDFLRFIQQLRSYLTVAEQQILFEEEARRPSPVASYLAVYALIAKGFSQRQPALIRRAKLMLMRLGMRQDVHLEQSVCMLLLGQTEEASQTVERSNDRDSLRFIREHSQQSPDLLPGLCLYSERWLQEEVFPHFRDLAHRQVSLKEYFADEQVQSYLEELPTDLDQGADRRQSAYAKTSPNAVSVSSGNSQSTYDPRTGTVAVSDKGQSAFDHPAETPTIPNYGNGIPKTMRGQPFPQGRIQATIDERALTNGQLAEGEIAQGGGEYPDHSYQVGTGPSHRSTHHHREDELLHATVDGEIDGETSRKRSRKANRDSGSMLSPEHPEVLPHDYRRPRSEQSPRLGRLFLVFAFGLACLLIGGFLTIRAFSWVSQAIKSSGLPPLEADQPQISLGQSPIVIPSPMDEVSVPGSAPGAQAALTKETAKALLEKWLAAKAEALGPNYATERLTEILVDPVLTQWQRQSEDAKLGGWYSQYTHEVVSVEAVETVTDQTGQAKVKAEVREAADFFEGGQLDPESSYNNTLQVQYLMVQQDGQWKIQAIEVLQ